MHFNNYNCTSHAAFDVWNLLFSLTVYLSGLASSWNPVIGRLKRRLIFQICRRSVFPLRTAVKVSHRDTKPNAQKWLQCGTNMPAAITDFITSYLDLSLLQNTQGIGITYNKCLGGLAETWDRNKREHHRPPHTRKQVLPHFHYSPGGKKEYLISQASQLAITLCFNKRYMDKHKEASSYKRRIGKQWWQFIKWVFVFFQKEKHWALFMPFLFIYIYIIQRTALVYILLSH